MLLAFFCVDYSKILNIWSILWGESLQTVSSYQALWSQARYTLDRLGLHTVSQITTLLGPACPFWDVVCRDGEDFYLELGFVSVMKDIKKGDRNNSTALNS